MPAPNKALLLILLYLVLAGASWIDRRFRIIPNRINVAVALLGLLSSRDLRMLLSFAIAAGILLFLSAFSRLFFKQAAMGAGDSKLFLSLSLWLAPWGFVTLMFLSCVFAILSEGLSHLMHKLALRFTLQPECIFAQGSICPAEASDHEVVQGSGCFCCAGQRASFLKRSFAFAPYISLAMFTLHMAALGQSSSWLLLLS